MENDQVTTDEQQHEEIPVVSDFPEVQDVPSVPTTLAADPEDMTMQIQLLQDIHTDLQANNELQMWLLGALMMVIGGMCIIAFFVARGEHSG